MPHMPRTRHNKRVRLRSRTGRVWVWEFGSEASLQHGLKRNTIRWFAVLAGAGLFGTARADTHLERLLEQYGRIQALTCQVRRESRTGDQQLRMLSQIWYQRPDRLFVESVAAGVDGITRRILADG